MFYPTSPTKAAIALGFSANEIAKLRKEPEDLEVKEIETGPVDDEFWISIRGPLARQANAPRRSTKQ